MLAEAVFSFGYPGTKRKDLIEMIIVIPKKSDNHLKKIKLVLDDILVKMGILFQAKEINGKISIKPFAPIAPDRKKFREILHELFARLGIDDWIFSGDALSYSF